MTGVVGAHVETPAPSMMKGTCFTIDPLFVIGSYFVTDEPCWQITPSQGDV
jgi:hypothetical protein